MPNKDFTAIDKSILKPFPNPSAEKYEVKIKIPEFTFLGVMTYATSIMISLRTRLAP